MENDMFPRVKKEIINFINDEEGNITRNKILAVGSMVILLSIIAGINAQAAHSSHSSHSSTESQGER